MGETMKKIEAVGVLIVVVALSVLFSETIFVSFAATLGVTLVEAAFGWLTLGVAILAGTVLKTYVTK